MVGGDVLPIAELAGRARCAGETHVRYGSTALGIRAVAARRDPAVAEFAASAPNAIEHPAPSPAPYLTWLERLHKWRRADQRAQCGPALQGRRRAVSPLGGVRTAPRAFLTPAFRARPGSRVR
jgi:hypothetical protein